MKRFFLIAGATCAFCATACGQHATDDASAASEDSIVGITNLAALETAFGLEGGAVDPNALISGDCYKAFIDDGDPMTWLPGEFEYRAYKNGAAFFAKKDSGYNSGDFRPVLCVDLHSTGGTTTSLSGVSLDAAVRFSLGKVLGKASDGAARLTLQFERGAMTINTAGDAYTRYSKAVERPALMDLSEAPTILGKLESVKVNGLYTDVMFDVPTAIDHDIPGYVAFFAFRYAWRAQETYGIFTQEGDQLGEIRDDQNNTLIVAETGGDAGGGATTWQMTRGQLTEGTQSIYDASADGFAGSEHFLRVDRPAEFQAMNPRIPPMAECAQKSHWDPQTQVEVPAGPWRCTGI